VPKAGESAASYINDLLSNEKEHLAELKDEGFAPKDDTKPANPFFTTGVDPASTIAEMEGTPSSLLESADITAPFAELSKEEAALQESLSQMHSKYEQTHQSLLEESDEGEPKGDKKKPAFHSDKLDALQKRLEKLHNDMQKDLENSRKHAAQHAAQKKHSETEKSPTKKDDDTPKKNPAKKEDKPANKPAKTEDSKPAKPEATKPAKEDKPGGAPASLAEVEPSDDIFAGVKEEIRALDAKEDDQLKDIQNGNYAFSVDPNGNLRKA